MSEEHIDELIEIVEGENHIPDVPPTEEEFASAQKILSTSEEVAEQAKQELEELESPLIVHKVTDASYQETASDISMDETHITDEGPTLERHRFRKEKKKGGKTWKFLLVLIVIVAAVFAGLYYGGVIGSEKPETTTKPAESTTETTTSIEQAYEGKIVLKGTYIFIDGVEVNGIEGLQNALKYEDPSPTAYEIIKEDANSDFLNNEVIPVMMKMGFYSEDTVISTIVNTGLVAEAEKTTVKKNNKNKNKKNKNKKNKQKTTKENTQE